MFDPTVWDNLKVVLEGAIYDLDMDGKIVIVDRNDIVNLAKMSRVYEIKFKLNDLLSEFPVASIKLFTDIDNLAFELQGHSNRKPGCKLEIKFSTILTNFHDECPKIEESVRSIWGETRQIEQILSFLYSNGQSKMKNEITVGFDRNMYEDNIDDLVEMIPYIIKTLEYLK